MSAERGRTLGLRVSRAEAVARRIETEIMDDPELSGSRLGTKEELRQRFGVAVATINEAVRLLEMRGMVEARPGPGGGVFVSEGSSSLALSHTVLSFARGGTTFSDCLEVREALDPLICREAARHADAADVRAFERIVDQMARQADDGRAYLALNYRLHRRIAKLSRNGALHSVYLSLLDAMERALERAELQDFDAEAHLAEHRELIAAIADGEGPRLEAAIARQAPSSGPR